MGIVKYPRHAWTRCQGCTCTVGQLLFKKQPSSKLLRHVENTKYSNTSCSVWAVSGIEIGIISVVVVRRILYGTHLTTIRPPLPILYQRQARQSGTDQIWMFATNRRRRSMVQVQPAAEDGTLRWMDGAFIAAIHCHCQFTLKSLPVFFLHWS